jgi:hypothetical protein
VRASAARVQTRGLTRVVVYANDRAEEEEEEEELFDGQAQFGGSVTSSVSVPVVERGVLSQKGSALKGRPPPGAKCRELREAHQTIKSLQKEVRITVLLRPAADQTAMWR